MKQIVVTVLVSVPIAVSVNPAIAAMSESEKECRAQARSTYSDVNLRKEGYAQCREIYGSLNTPSVSIPRVRQSRLPNPTSDLRKQCRKQARTIYTDANMLREAYKECRQRYAS